MSEANTKVFWKELFLLLSKNNQLDDQIPPMWAQFKTNRLNRSDIETAIESFKDQLEDNVKAELDKLLKDTSEAQLLDLMKSCTLLGDNFWCLLFAAIRDKESHLIGDDKTVPILEGGQTKLMTIKDIEENFLSENESSSVHVIR